ncbi:MAG: hypothetical protein K0U72_02835 [Gammaproteobacteria bacterium]|nr:hypothetical protein [Gammaproteobacteria bacterium]
MREIPNFNLQARPGYLRFDYADANPTLTSGIPIFSAIAEDCKLIDQDKVLVVARLAKAPSIVDTYHLAEMIAELFQGLKIAYVLVYDGTDSTQEKSFSAIKFGEDVAFNRGGIAKVFQNESEAEKWLMSS